jgi:adenylate cyclase
MALLRAFHTRVERAVFLHGGMVDKFIGDGALACFGVPEPSADDCAAALRAARALDADLAAWGEAALTHGRQPLQAGIGIHHGSILAGDIGGDRQFQFTVIGDTVNVASRIEALTRPEHASIVISDAVAGRAAADDPDALQGLERLTPRLLRGVDEPIGLWRLARRPQ